MNRRNFILSNGALALSWPLLRSARAATPSAEAWERAADIVRNVRAPTFPDRVFDVTKFGAIPDARTLATTAIAKAIESCAAAGGGRVLVPDGTYLTGAIHLKS